MKKRIIFIVVSLNTGGIIRALQNFLNCYSKEECEVDVFSMVHFGVYNGKLNNCNILPRNRILEATVAHFENQKGLSKVESLVLKVIDKLSNYLFQSFLMRRAGKIILKEKKYDAIIGFSEGLATRFVSMMKHPNKIGWIHCDYASYFQLNGNKTELTIYEKLNHVVCVSAFTCQTFCNIYPSIADKTIFIYNIIDDCMMKEKAKEPINEPFDNLCFNIVSVGRIDPIKRISMVPVLARKVVDSGCKIRWYVLGPKGTNDEVKRFENNMTKYTTKGIVLPLGEKANPYPYIAKADLLVNTSISEACPYVINEAKILNTPVVCTDFGSAKEFIEYGVNGYYEPLEKISDRIVDLVNKSNEIMRLKTNLKSFSYDNDAILKQIYNLIL